jgi:hypothetical protein
MRFLKILPDLSVMEVIWRNIFFVTILFLAQTFAQEGKEGFKLLFCFIVHKLYGSEVLHPGEV